MKLGDRIREEQKQNPDLYYLKYKQLLKRVRNIVESTSAEVVAANSLFEEALEDEICCVNSSFERTRQDLLLLVDSLSEKPVEINWRLQRLYEYAETNASAVGILLAKRRNSKALNVGAPDSDRFLWLSKLSCFGSDLADLIVAIQSAQTICQEKNLSPADDTCEIWRRGTGFWPASAKVSDVYLARSSDIDCTCSEDGC